MIVRFCLIVFLITSIISLKAQQKTGIRTLPDSVLVTDIDLQHYWNAFDSCMTTTDSIKQVDIVQRLYIDRGSIALKALVEKDSMLLNEDGRHFDKSIASIYAGALVKRDKYLKSIRPVTLTFIKKADSLRAAYKRLKRLYPVATFSDVYILVTPFMHGGTPVEGGFIIGAEMISKTSAADLSQLSKKAADFISTPDHFIPLIVHENAHTMQKEDNESTLLSRSLVEGAADFVTKMTVGRVATQDYIYNYGDKHEKELWVLFKKDMLTKHFSDWYQSDGGTGAVPDLGYFMGYKICEAYYKNAKNKSAAFKDIVEMSKDADTFLKVSKYEEKFKN